MSDSHKAPLFSIITITRNHLAGLRRTYDSIAMQSVQNFEWVVIDGASTDGTVFFLKNETNRIQNKTVISEQDGGIYEAMNKGIKRAKGTYVLFMNAGDEFADSVVLSMLVPHTERDSDFIYGDALEGNPPHLKSARRYKDLPWGMFTHHQAMLYRRQTIEEQKLRYSILYDIAGDYDFTARFLKRAKAIIYVPKPICIFEQGGVSQQKAALGRQEQFIIRENLRLVSQLMNVWIYTVQSAAWRLKRLSPGLYAVLKRTVLGVLDRRTDRKKAKRKV